MKKLLLFLLLNVILCLRLSAQNYNNIVNFASSGTPVYGVKIKTNIPFRSMYTIPYIKIEGLDYGKYQLLNITLSFYVFDDVFHFAIASSHGSSTPDIWVSDENGKISIFLDEKVYFQRFTVSAYAKGQEQTEATFQEWTVVDEPLSGAKRKKADYSNNFAGKVGIGVCEPMYELDVKGTIRAEEIKVASDWADFVFKKDYQLPTLKEVENHINEKGTLPNIPNEKEVKANGVNLSEMNTLLLQKIEELTLYIINQSKEINELKLQVKSQNK